MKMQTHARCSAHLSIAVRLLDAGVSAFFVYQMGHAYQRRPTGDIIPNQSR